jgi:hypothetical protein
MCDETKCLSMLDGEPLYRDTTHLRRNLEQGTLMDLAKLIGVEAIFDR